MVTMGEVVCIDFVTKPHHTQKLRTLGNALPRDRGCCPHERDAFFACRYSCAASSCQVFVLGVELDFSFFFQCTTNSSPAEMSFVFVSTGIVTSTVSTLHEL